jgi:TfoX/Sxy family transcriptional regulator of competence genes
MQMPKASDADKDRFRALVPAGAGVEVKPMFGNLGAFVNGTMFAGLFGSSVGVKLSESDLVELSTVDGTHPFGPAERPMSGYLSLPEAWLDEPAMATPWMQRALTHVAQLPPKPKKRPTKAAGKSRPTS